MDIDEFLTAQKESGQVESQGVFTVAVEKARQKLGQFQLDDPSFYLLKIIQAAVEGGATRIELRTSRHKLALWFDAPAPLGSFEQFLTALRNPLEGPSGPIKSLALGFNAGLFSEPLQVSFVWWGGQDSQAVVAVDHELAMTAAPGRPSGVSSSDNLYVFSVTKKKLGWFESATRQEHAAICKFCSYCPVEIRIDGRKLEAGRQAPPRNEPWLATYSEPFHLVEHLAPDPSGGLRVALPAPLGRRRGKSGWLRSDRAAETFALQPLTDPKPLSKEVVCQSAYALPLGLRGADKLIFICHGVKVATVSINSNGAGASGVVSADHLSFDLSGFGVLRNEDFHNLAARANWVWSEMAESVRLDLEKLTGTVTEKERAAKEELQKSSFGCSMFSCCGVWMVLANLPLFMGDFGVLAGLLMALAGGAYVPYLKKRVDPHQRLRDAVEHRLDQLREHWPKG